jgi:hypothetical protein
MLGVPGIAAQLAASKGGLSSMELVIFILLLFHVLKLDGTEKMKLIKTPLTYSISLKKVPLLSLFLSLSHVILFAEEVIKGQVFNRIVCFMSTIFIDTLIFL